MAQVELPRYRCHKEVRALKIAQIYRDGDAAGASDGGAMITPADPGFSPLKVDFQYMRKHDPKVGGYFVVYRDGYTSWSPASEFEDGYTRIS